MDDDGDNIGVIKGVGTASFPGAEACFPFLCFFDTHGVPCSSCTCERVAELGFHLQRRR